MVRLTSTREKELLTWTFLKARDLNQSETTVLCSGDFAPMVLEQCRSDW